MGSFTGVVTTGIYCQPDCSARPRAENTHSFPLAAAAEAAGYRACKRCRPYRYPQTIEWSAPECVCRGVRLILDGALDEATEEDLARRLGISARHLRRLFIRHVGVTPDGLARSARVHFARRLLDDTDLSVTEIAFAAGFGSLRQFNRACRDVFHESPRALRSRRRKADRLVADGGLPLRLAFIGDLNWPAMLDHFAARAIPGVERIEGDVYRRTIVVDDYPGVLELSPGGCDYLVLCAHLPRWDEIVHIVQRARAVANLDLCLDEPERVLANDPVIGCLLRSQRGLRPPGAWDVFEVAVHAILTQVATAQMPATKLIGRIVNRFGTPVAGLEPIGLSHTFPSPATLATAELHSLGIARARAAAINALARAVADARVELDRSVSLERLIASLSALEGVDGITANYIALRLGEPDACPLSDLQLERVSAGRAMHRSEDDAERWRPWRAVAISHLWHAHARRAADAALGGAA